MACACQDGGRAATPSPFKGPGTEPGQSERLVTWDLQGVTLGTITWLPRFLSQSAYFGSQFEGTLFTTVEKAWQQEREVARSYLRESPSRGKPEAEAGLSYNPCISYISIAINDHGQGN